ncbi:MAG: GNAT family N-acetyltransferase [Acidimicrobiales bacterium]
MLPDGYEITQLREDELPTLFQWAAAEGWNPGIGDLEAAWAFDPDAFLALRHGDELAGTGAIFSYDGAFGFMGLFIVRRDLRGDGLGTALWYERRDRLQRRLAAGASIGMDGVFDMVPFYERGGFALAFRGLRFEGVAPEGLDAPVGLVPLADVGFDAVEAYDRRHVPVPRPTLLRIWLDRPEVHGVAVVDDGEVVAYAAARPGVDAVRIGPVFADSPELADRVVAGILAGLPGQTVHLDVPEVNPAGLDLVARLGWRECFGCARMYLGPTPALPVERIYGITSFEFG